MDNMRLDDLQKSIMDNRTEIMGLACISIMLFHSTFVIPFRFLQFFIDIGYIGVDIFVFISGMSMFYSYYVNCKCDRKKFYQKRVGRVLPAYIVFLIIAYTYSFIVEYNLLLSAYVTEIKTFKFWHELIVKRWFVPFIMLMYFFTPLIHLLIEKYKFKAVILLVILPLALSVLFWGKSTILIGGVRVPEYIIGYYFSYICYTQLSENRLNIIALVISLCVGIAGLYILLDEFQGVFLAEHGLYWYPVLLIFIPITAFAAIGITHLKSHKFKCALGFFGKYSLEIYLWHYFMICLVGALNSKGMANFTLNALAVLITIAVAVVSQKITWDLWSRLYEQRDC